MLVLLSYGCASSGVVRSSQAAVVATQVLDLHSTHAALSSGKGVEGNPLRGSTWYQQAALKLPLTAGVVYLTTKLERHNRILATVVNAALATGVGIIAGQNYRIAGSDREDD